MRADLLKERSGDSGMDFSEMMQADFVLFVRDHLDRPDIPWHWFPETLLYACDRPRGFEIFERSGSLKYFERVKILLGIEDKKELGGVVEKIHGDAGRYLPRWEYTGLPLKRLLAYDRLGTSG